MPANDDDHLGHYQFGNYLFTKEHTSTEEMQALSTTGGGDYPPTTRYTMTRQPNATEREGLGEDWAPAFDVGTLDVNHHPAKEPLPERRIVGNRPVEPRLSGQEVPGSRMVYSREFKERHLPSDEVDFLTVAKSSRVMAPTLLGLGQRAALATTGQDLQASSSLSVHSQRLVDHLKSAGMVPETHQSTRNQLSFMEPWPMSTPGGLEGHFSTLTARRAREGGAGEQPIPATEVAAGREEGRSMARRSGEARRQELHRLAKSPIRPSI